MNTIRQFVGAFRDSPNYGRDRANLIGGFSVGIAALLLNLVVLVMVSPFMIDPDGFGFREFTEKIEFGQLLALILLGGTTVFATLLIPLRMVTVFWGPRIGRYFDQIVLSGITPFRFLIGKATSQNLFLGLIGFLLLPYFVLSISMGGIDFGFFLAGLFLIWLYCMTLALTTLWLSLYFNELLAAIMVIVGASFMLGFGCAPLPFQPFVLSPAPMLIHPLHIATQNFFFPPVLATSLWPKFFACAIGMGTLCGLALLGVYLGPLFGIIRENSTFGEVVRKGDAKRKKWFRFRHHIQRPSELAFFYENRGEQPLRNEGLVRWSIALGVVSLAFATAYVVYFEFLSRYATQQAPPWYFVPEFHFTHLMFLGVGLVIAAYVFSHSKNSTLMDVTYLRGKKANIGRLDTIAFLSFAVFATAFTVGFPWLFESLFGDNAGRSIFYDPSSRTQYVNWPAFALEAPIVLLISGLTIYAWHRWLCSLSWVKSFSFLATVGLYGFIVGAIPVIFTVIYIEVDELQRSPLFVQLAPLVTALSPACWFPLKLGELPNRDGYTNATSAPFYVLHGLLLILAWFAIRRRERQLRQDYLAPLGQESPAQKSPTQKPQVLEQLATEPTS